MNATLGRTRAMIRVCLGLLGWAALWVPPAPAEARGFRGKKLTRADDASAGQRLAATETQQNILMGLCTLNASERGARCNDPDYARTACGRAEAQKALSGATSSACRATCRARGAVPQCANEPWWNSVCGQLHASVVNQTLTLGAGQPHPSSCVETAANGVQTGSVPMPGAPVAVVDPPRFALQGTSVVPVAPASNGRTQAVRVTRSRADHAMPVAFQTSLYGQQSKAFTELSKPGTSNPFAAAQAALRAGWEADGNVVSSCSEYVYEKYYDWSRFEDGTHALGGDYRATFSLAYGPAQDVRSLGTRGIQGIPMASKDGTSNTPQISFPKGPQAKNAFFDVALAETGVAFPLKTRAEVKALAQSEHDPVKGLQLARPLVLDSVWIDDDALYAALMAGKPVTHTENWAWHKSASDTLAADGWLDEELYALDGPRTQLADLLYERDLAVGAIKDHWERQAKKIKDKLDALVELQPFFDPSIRYLEGISPLRGSPYTRQLGDVKQGLDQSWLDVTRDVAVGDISLQAVVPPSAGAFALGSLGLGIPGWAPPPGAVATPYSLTTGGGATQKRNTSLSVGSLNEPAGFSVDEVDLATALLDSTCKKDPLLCFAQRVQYLDVLIEETLKQAQTLGCLALNAQNPARVGRCDWSPRMFMERLRDPFSAVREPAFRRCNDHSRGGFLETYAPSMPMEAAALGNQFSVTMQTTGSAPPTQTGAGNKIYPVVTVPDGRTVRCDKTAYNTTLLVEAYPLCVDAWMRIRIREFRNAMQSPNSFVEENRFGQKVADGVQLGNDLFNVKASYDVGWSVADLEPVASQTVGYCNVDLHSHASAEASARALFAQARLLSLSAAADVGQPSSTSGQTARARLHLEVMGETVPDVDVPMDMDAFNVVDRSITYGGEGGTTLAQASATFVVVVVPVTVTGGMAGRLGAAASVAGGSPPETAGCGAGFALARSNVMPFVEVNAFASASVNLVIAEAGIKANLVLLSMQLPFTSELDFRNPFPGPGSTQTEITANNRLEFVFSMLSGNLSAFVEVCYVFDCDRFDAELFRWDGPTTREVLFRTEAELAAEPVARYLTGSQVLRF